jgi:glycogen synthase
LEEAHDTMALLPNCEIIVPMKIAILSREYPPDSNWGGIASVYYGLSNGLARKGHQVHVICQAAKRPEDLENDGIFIHRVGTNSKRYSALARINYSLHAWLKLRELIANEGLELVEATQWGAEAFLYSWRKTVPLIVRLDVSAPDILSTKTFFGLKQLTNLKILSFLENFCTKRADRVIAISESLFSRATAQLNIPPGKLDLIYPGVDTSVYRFVKSDIRIRLGIAAGSPMVLFVGRLEKRKGIDILFQAIPEIIRNVPGACFVLVGQDTLTAPEGRSIKAYLTQQAKGHGFAGNLFFTDQMAIDQLVQMYSECDVFVLPSLNEGFAMTILEAMACGKPVVTTSTSDINFKPPGGIIVPPGKAAELAMAITQLLLLNREDKILAARTNRDLIEAEFSISAWIERIVEVYEKTLKQEKYG